MTQSPAMLDRVYAKLPHAGAMRLLAQVLHWDSEHVLCSADSHRAPDNPLRRDGALAAVHAVEYAAQAAAVHGVLVRVLDGGPVLVLAAVRALELDVDRLDTLPAALRVSAWREAGAGPNAIYRFALDSEGRACARGTITLMQRREVTA